MITDFGEISLLLELHLVEDEIAGRGGPVDRETVVPRDPFGADVGVDRHGVGAAIIGRCRYRHVGEGDGLIEQIARLVLTGVSVQHGVHE